MNDSQLATINQAYVYQIWFGLGGDLDLTSRATGLSREVLRALAHDYQWMALSGGKLGLANRKQEKEVNRAISYAQGRRLSDILDRAMALIEENPDRLREAMFTETEDGRKQLSAKPLVELAKALETAHSIQYRALGDKVAEQADAVVDNDRIKSLSLTVISAVNNASANAKIPPEIVLDSVVSTN